MLNRMVTKKKSKNIPHDRQIQDDRQNLRCHFDFQFLT